MKSFPPFRLDSIDECLWRGGERVGLTPKAFDLLRYLVEHPGRLVTQDELLESLWPETYVQPEVLRKHVLEIRKALGDDPKEPRFVETQPKRGYRFVAAVQDEQVGTASPPVAEAEVPLVGRERELAALDQALEKALHGQRQIVFVTGEAGIGKTSLLDAFEQRLARRGRVLSARGQSVEGFGGKEAYYPVLDALGQLARGPGSASVVKTLAATAPTWLTQFPSLVKAEQREMLQREILGATRERMVREICEALESLTAETPVVLMLEDLHWGDHSTFDLISALARRRGAARLVLLGTYRPVDVILAGSALKGLKQDLLIHRLCLEVPLERLCEADVTEALELPVEVGRLVHRHSGGNPLFMAAIAEHLVEQGILVRNGEGWKLTKPVEQVDPGVPETLQRMLEIQFDPLGEELRSVLRAASVVGQRFWTCAVGSMLEQSTDHIDALCDGLAARQHFIRHAGMRKLHDGPDSTAYEFRHSLYREFLYRRLPATQRWKLHKRLADAIERRLGSWAADDPGIASELALHFEEGQDCEKAVRYALVAARNAARRSAQREAIEALEHALQLLPRAAPEAAKKLEIEVRLAIGDAWYALGAMDKSAEACGKAAAVAEEAGLPGEQVDALMRQTRPITFFDVEGCYAISRRAIEISANIGDELRLCRAKLAEASWKVMLEGFESGQAVVCTGVFQKIRELGGMDQVASDLGHFAHVQVMQSEYLEAAETADACLKSLSGKTSLWDYLTALAGRALCFLHTGQLGQAFRLLEQGCEMAAKNGNEPWLAILRGALGWASAITFDAQGARELCTPIVEAGPHFPFDQAWAQSTITLGMTELQSGNPRRALDYLQRVLDWKVDRPLFLRWYWLLLARFGLCNARVLSGDTAGARIAADEFLAVVGPDNTLRSMAWTTKAYIAMLEHQIDEARECVANALSAIGTFEVPVAAWRAHEAAWQLHAALGEAVTAEEHRVKAASILRSLAESMEPGDRRRQSLLAAPQIRGILGEAVARP
jgi:DNA-binding winged helix-turn-helix (wHTH) protein/tetratricopeptide (TPR) repeat protein